jgi:hypothetical protein
MDREMLIRDLAWLAEGNPRYAGTDEEGEQNPAVARLMAEDLLLSYIGDAEVTAAFNEVRRGYSP